MYDVVHLESQWRAYKRKRVLVPALIVSVLAGVIFTGYVFWPSTKDHTDGVQKQTERRSLQKHPEVSQNASTEKAPVLPTPSLTVLPRKAKGWNMTFTDTKTEKKNAGPLASVHPVRIEVTTRKNEVSAQEIEKRFRFAKDKDDALFLARYYYEKKAYKKALSWALETNKLDSDIEESWLIFGQAKARLGQRVEAIRVLQAYYDRTGSPKAQKLLDEIRRGKTP